MMKHSLQSFISKLQEMKIFSHSDVFQKVLERKIKGLIWAVALMWSFAANGQFDCNVSMACNDTIQVSLEVGCFAAITPHMMLEGQDYLE